MAQEILVTAEGKAELEAELQMRKTTLRSEIKERIRYAKSQGDLSENSEYDEARADEGKNESIIQELEEKLKHVRVISEHELTYDKVHVGCTVVLKRADGSELTYHIVGSTEVDPFKHRISDQSPIGLVIYGKCVGDKVQIRDKQYEIASIAKYQK